LLHYAAALRALNSFPTRRSSDLGHPTDRIRQTPGRRLQELLKEPLLVSEFAFLPFQLFTQRADEFVLFIERRTVSGQSGNSSTRSEEHTSELQSRFDLVCRLLLE